MYDVSKVSRGYGDECQFETVQVMHSQDIPIKASEIFLVVSFSLLDRLIMSIAGVFPHLQTSVKHQDPQKGMNIQ